MIKKSLFATIIGFSIVIGGLCAPEADPLFKVFQDPLSIHRPFVRWWWNGSYVTEKEILRELDVMKAGGIGGVEINTIGMLEAVPRDTLAGLKALAWLSPEWNGMIRTAAVGARERGMTTDLIGEDPVPVPGVWEVEFCHVDPSRSFSRKLETLLDLSKAADDPAMASFAGTAIYRMALQVKPDTRTFLDLGQIYGISEVVLNGKPLGVRWYGRHVYDAGTALQPGINRLEVRVTTMLGNYCKSLSGSNPVAKRWASWFPPIAAGMVGPVRFLRPR